MQLGLFKRKNPKTIILWSSLIVLIVCLCILLNRKQEISFIMYDLPENIKEPHTVAYLPINLYNNCTLDPPKLFIGKKCTKFPSLNQIEFDNTYWQKTTIDDIEVYIYGAYYDNRSSGAVIRMLVASEDLIPSNAVCQVWFKNHGTVVESKIIEKLYSKGFYKTLMINCDVPEIFDDRIPHSVSLVSYECAKASNALQLSTDFNHTAKKDITVCVTDLSLDITPGGFIEWIEFIKSLGISKIHFYNLFQNQLSEENGAILEEIVNYYVLEGTVNITPITLPGRLPNIPRLQRVVFEENPENIFQWSSLFLHDCFYSNLEAYHRISYLNIKEINLPSEVDDWLIWSFETITNLSIKPDGSPENYRKVTGNRIFSYSTDKVISLGYKNKAPICLTGTKCDIDDIAMDFLELNRESFDILLGRINNVKKQLLFDIN